MSNILRKRLSLFEMSVIIDTSKIHSNKSYDLCSCTRRRKTRTKTSFQYNNLVSIIIEGLVYNGIGDIQKALEICMNNVGLLRPTKAFGVPSCKSYLKCQLIICFPCLLSMNSRMMRVSGFSIKRAQIRLISL